MTLPGGSDIRNLRRAVYWANHGRSKDLPDMLRASGFDMGHRWQEAQARNSGEPYHEWWIFGKDNATLALIHQFDNETFLFAWTPEARAPRWRQLLWRARHPRRAVNVA